MCSAVTVLLRHFLVFFFTFPLFLIAAASLASEAHLGPVLHGVTQGEAGVDAQGAANYAVAIEMPPGTNGMVPSLSLSYNSLRKNGLLGIGWVVEGLDSKIVRCPQTIVQDGQNRAVDLSAEDRFCMDGHRLLAVNGAYGADGTEYRTESDEFSRIISHGQTTGNPDYWVVERKDGLTLTYGGTNDARMEVKGGSEHSLWYLSKSEDELGNYYSLSYTRPGTIATITDSYIRPSRIDYTGNAGQSLSPYASIRFEYEARTDVSYRYELDKPIYADKRLKNIKSFVGETLVTDYQLSYDYSPSSKRSRLISLRKCALGGDCTEPSVFSWSDSGDGSNTLSGVDSTGANMPFETTLGDFNGDGRTDALQQSNTYTAGATDSHLYLADENGDLVLAQTIPGNHLGADFRAYNNKIITGDFNGDGRTDLFLQPTAGGSGGGHYFYILLADANGHFTSVLQSESASSGYNSYLGFAWNELNRKIIPGDYNGDGRTDLYLQGRDNYQYGDNYVVLADSDGKFTAIHQAAALSSGGYKSNSYKAIPGDFNGDGKTDLLFQHLTANFVRVALSDQEGKFTDQNSTSTSYIWGAYLSTLIPGDFNGDGRTDFFIQRGYSNSQVVLANEDGSFSQDSIRYSFPPGNYDWRSDYATIHTGDFNGDGLADLYVDGRFESRIHLTQPDSTFSADNAEQILDDDFGITWFYPTITHNEKIGDFNGDGRSDILLPYSGKVLYGNSGQPFADQLISAVDGLGVQTGFSYKPMTDNSVYTRGAGAVYPDQVLESTRYLVAEFKQSDGFGGFNTETYAYEDAKRRLTGRGDLGFAKITAVSAGQNKTTITEYEQNFPFLHLPKKVEVKRTSDGRLMSSEELVYSGVGSPTAMMANVIADPNPIPDADTNALIGSMIEKFYDLGSGDLLSTKTTTNQRDAYGNITGKTVLVEDHYNNQTFETQTLNTYNVNTADWRVGQLLTQTIQKKVDAVVNPGLGSALSYSYDALTGLRLSVTHNPNAGAPSEITETYTYDGFGNAIAQVISGPGIAPSAASNNYDSRGQFPLTLIDALGNREDRVYDDRFGIITSLSDNNNLVTGWQYDDFGQVALETRPDGSSVATSVHLDNSGSNPPAVSYTEVIATGVPPVRTFVDALSRAVRVRTQDGSSNYIHKDTEYNAQGFIRRSTGYYPAGAAIPWNTYTYDELGRITNLVAADGNNSYSTVFYGFTDVLTYATGHIIITVKNALDQIKGVIDNQKSDIAYTSMPNNDGDGSYSISWDQGGGLYTSYVLQEQVNGGGWSTIQDSASTSKSISGKGNGAYGYQVKGCISLGCSGYTSLRTVNVAIAPGVPASVSVSPNPAIDDNHTVSWGSSSGDVSLYELEQNFDGNGYVLKYAGTALSYFIGGLADGSYLYRVRACKTTGSFTNCSDYQTGSATSVSTAVAPGVPQNLTVPATDDDGAYTVTWSAGTGSATRFELQELAAGSSWTSVQNNSATGYAVTGSGSGSYSYRVRACNASGCSNFTAAETVVETLAMDAPVLLTPAINATVPGNQDTCFTWQAVAGVTYYNVQISLGTDFSTQQWVFKDATIANPVCWSDGAGWEALGANSLPTGLGLKPGTHYWRVWAKDAPNGNHLLATVSNLGSFTVGEATGDGSVNTPPAPYAATPPPQNAAEVLASDQVGSTAGQFRVDESGSATYSIPIATAAGTAGVAPQLSLNYSSQGGNGLVGKGWNIGGLSGITRCRQTMQQDGEAKPITWSNTDRFCLDGQRLINVSGSYGAVGTLYKTEIDSFAKVTSVGGSSGHPAYFKVERKDGSVSYYGNTTDSKQKAGGSSHVLTWAINRFEDSVGNPISFVYLNDSKGQRIGQIFFAYGSSGSNQAHLKFDYELRGDGIMGYVGGYQFQTTERLKGITSYNNGTPIREYKLEYLATAAGGDANKTSKLASLQECRGASCLPATTFSWEADQIGFNASSDQSSFAGDAMGNYRPADINGDGKMDLVWTRLYIGTEHVYYHLRYALSDGTKLTDMNWDVSYGETKAGSARKPREWDILDYNGDGRTDVVIKNATGYTYEVYLSEPQADGSWRLATTSITTPAMGVQTSFADVDSDGLTEVVYVEPSGTKFYTRDLIHDTGQGIGSNRYYRFGAPQEISRPWPALELNPGNPSDPQSVSLDASALGADFNGDGMTDAVATYNYSFGLFGAFTQRFALIKRKGTGADPGSYEIYSQIGSFFSYNLETEYRDLNGDGLTDVYFRTTDKHWHYMLNTGAGFGSATDLGVLDEAEAIQLTDYNQDGYLDIVWHNGSNQLKVRTWDGSNERFNSEVVIKNTGGGNNIKHLLLDVNGDGLGDYVKVRVGESNYIQVYQNLGVDQPRNVITRISNGLGADTDISYGSLSNSGHYERLTVGATSGSTEFCWGTYCHTYTYGIADTASFYSALNGDWDIPSGSHSFGKDEGPVLELNGPIYVVTEAKSDAPVSGNNAAQSRISYYYAEAKLQASGRGFLGFERIKSVDEQTGVETVTSYRQDFPFIGYPAKTEVFTGSGDRLSEAENIWKLQGWSGAGSEPAAPYRPYIATSTEKTYSTSTNLAVADKLDVSTTGLQTVVTNNSYDAYGNPLTINVTTSGGGDSFSKNTTNLYGSSTYEQEKGRLSRTEVQSTRNGQSETRISAFNYYTSGQLKGLLKDEIIEPDNSQYSLTTSYEYDEFGNKVKATQSAAGEASRFTQWVYDQGRYVKQTINSLGQTTEQVIDRNDYGAPTQVQNIDGVNTYISYSKLGRQYFSYSETGVWSQTLSSSGSTAPNGAYQVTTTQAGGGETIEHFDRLGRRVRSASRGFDGSWVYQDTEYDNLGRVSRISQPYFSGGAIYWTTNSYDILGRLIASTRPDSDAPDGNNDSSISYDGLTTAYSNDKGQTKTEIKNLQAELIEVIDHLGGKILYSYDPQGNMTQLQAIGNTSSSGLANGVSGSLTTSLSYDLLGRKISMNDPDKGVWHYNYNHFGELTAQLDAKGQCSVITYDILGRQKNRKDSTSGDQNNGVISCNTASNYLEGDTVWTYNDGYPGNQDSDFGRGQLDNVMDHKIGYIKFIHYDDFGRVSETGTVLDGAMDDHVEKITYDQYGRTFQIFDAARDDYEFNDNGIEYQYNSTGYLSKVVDAMTANATTYYEVLEMDQRGKVKKERLGNGHTTTRSYDAKTGRLTHIGAGLGATLNTIQDIDYQWDQLGNLSERHSQSGSKDIEESFQYDGLNRLTRADVTGGAYTLTSYDAYGNIKTKNTYHSGGTHDVFASVGAYSYDGPNGGPHAVTATGIGNLSYQYDANGNLTQNGMADGDTRTIQYTSFDKPKQIVKGNHRVEFEYGPDRARYKRIDTNISTSAVTTTLYIGSVEKITHPNGSKDIKRYINGVAIITQHYSSSNTLTGADTRYLYKDHLGSLDFMTDEFGAIIQEMSFDAWGKRRSATDWTTWQFSISSVFDHTETTRGYTGHEMLDEVGLIHMNGRVYDPHLGRFVQADPFVQAPAYTQSLNRYSYGFNNPLNGTDPSGFIFGIDDLIIGAVIGAAFGAAGKELDIPILSTIGSIISCGTGIGCATGFAFGATLGAGGSLSDAFQSGLFTAISASAFSAVGGSEAFGYAIGDGPGRLALNALANGFVGGILSQLQGGKFGHGFISAGISALAKPGLRRAFGTELKGRPFRIAARAIIGGTLSQATGGKFTNGAITAAFSQMYNEERTLAQKESFGEFFLDRVLSGQIRDDIFAALGAELSVAAGGAELFLTYVTGGAAGAFIGLHGAGNLAGGIGDYLNIFDGGNRDYNLTRQGYENIFEAAGQNPANGARAFYFTDAAIGVGALFSPVTVNVVGPYTIQGTTTVPAFTRSNPAILTHDAVQLGSSVNSGVNQ